MKILCKGTYWGGFSNLVIWDLWSMPDHPTMVPSMFLEVLFILLSGHCVLTCFFLQYLISALVEDPLYLMCWQWGIKTIIKTIRCRFYLFELHDSLPLYPWLKILVKFGEMAPSSWCRELFDSNLKAASNFDTIAFNLGSSRERHM